MALHRRSRGSTLLDVLVTLVILSIALLGAVAMQLKALQLGQSSQWRDQAVTLAADLAERIEANKAAAVDGAYAVVQTSTVPSAPPSCTAACSPAEVAALDLYQWQTRIASVLPNSAWSVQQTTRANPGTYEISLRWADAHGAHDASYTATRTVYRP